MPPTKTRSGTAVTRRPSIDIRSRVAVIGVSDGPDKGVLYTLGLKELGHTELLVPPIPIYLQPFATMLINECADFIVNGGEVVREGESLALPIGSRQIAVKFVAHEYKGEKFWRLSDEPMEGMCQSPGHAHGHEHGPGCKH